MTTLIFTGNAGPGIAQAAAAAALRSAEAGRRTLLISFGTPQSLGALLGAPLGAAPTAVAPDLDALALDPLAALGAAWDRNRAHLPEALARVPADELPLLPGSESFFGLAQLGEQAARYQQVVLDAGPHEALLRTLATPDSLRWTVRLLLGLDRGAGRSPASAGRALLPTAFIPADFRDRVQDLRVQVEEARAALLERSAALAQYVLRPDLPALADAQLAVPALQLHGLAVAGLLVGPLLPGGAADARLGPLLEAQAAVLEQARGLWGAQATLAFEAPAPGLEGLRALGQTLAGAPAHAPAPVAYQHEGAPAVVVALPSLPRGALQITLSGDELIIRIGPYRRHILLPEGLRGHNDIRATREGDRLIVRRRSA